MHSRRQKGQQGARKGQQGVAPCYLHLAGPLVTDSYRTPDRTDIKGHHRTRNGFTGLETDIKRILTDTNGLKEFLSVTHPLARCDRNLRDLQRLKISTKAENKVRMHQLTIQLKYSFSWFKSTSC